MPQRIPHRVSYRIADPGFGRKRKAAIVWHGYRYGTSADEVREALRRELSKRDPAAQVLDVVPTDSNGVPA